MESANTTTPIAPKLSRLINSTLTSLTTTALPHFENLTTISVNLPTSSNTSTLLPLMTSSLTMATSLNSTVLQTKSVIQTVTESAKGSSKDGSFSSLVFLSVVLFIVAVAVVGKIVYSNRRRRSDLIGGTARWRLSASQQSGAGPQQTAANYVPMGRGRQTNGRNGLDTPGPDRLDWERQFFDDTDATVPSRLQLDLSMT